MLRRQLYLILALRCLRTASFAQPVLVVWFADVGLSPAGVLWLGSFYSALVILAEVPSGLISDRLGRRRTLHWAFLALAASLGVAALVWLGLTSADKPKVHRARPAQATRATRLD